jgi:ABC-type amino acid transport substrate-binding protein
MNKNLSLIDPGILSIGVDASAPLPLHSDPTLPDFEGFEVDLMKSVTARLGVSVSYKNALWSKLIDDLLEDSPIAQAFVRSTPGLRLAATIPGTDAQYGTMFRKGDDELRIAINDALAKIEADGTYAEIYRKWFNENSRTVTRA